jgi:hypothetical protein
MNLKEIQSKVIEGIKADAEKMIDMAIKFNPKMSAQISEQVAAIRKVSGTTAGIASIAIREALRGSSNEDTIKNMELFVGGMK